MMVYEPFSMDTMVISLISSQQDCKGEFERERETDNTARGECFQAEFLHVSQSVHRSANILCPKSNVESWHSDVGENANFTLPRKLVLDEFVYLSR